MARNRMLGLVGVFFCCVGLLWVGNFQMLSLLSRRAPPSSSFRQAPLSSTENLQVDREVDSVSSPSAVVDWKTYERATGRRDRVYCMVPSLYKPSRVELMRTILKTWGPRCDVVKFFVDALDDVEIPAYIEEGGTRGSIVAVNMKRKGGICSDGLPCRHIWEKVWRSWVYVFENDLDSAEWFLKVDDDTFLIPSNIRKWTRDHRWDPDEPHYFGHLVYIEDAPFKLISGVCTAFSREAIRRLGPRLLAMKHEYGPRENFPESHGQCVDRDGATEERVTSKCLAEVGVFAEETLEFNKSEAVLPLGIPFTLTYFRKKNSTSWYWHKKPWTRGDMFDCCSKNYTWGIHGYKGSGSRLLRMDNMLYHTSVETLMHKRDAQKHMSDGWAQFEFVRLLQDSIRKDPFAYPPFP